MEKDKLNSVEETKIQKNKEPEAPRPFSSPEQFYDCKIDDFPRASKALIKIVEAILFVFAKLWTRYEVYGIEHLEKLPDEEGFIFVANHSSMLDPVFLALLTDFSPKVRRHLPRFMFKSEFTKSPLMHAIMARAGAFPVKRDSADMKALKRAVKYLKRGEDVGIFPEGTRHKNRSGKNKVYGGFALIAHMAHTKVVPIAIEGGWRLPYPRKIRIKIGKPLAFTDFPEALSKKEKLALMEEQAMDAVYAMRDELDSMHAHKKA
ncbi:MAG: lysophospholipid acyltransferase family protein [Coriobacteriia bacterium]|nr:lysophospholipid acyltransferase family protein [Coriobacteriia bacterium]